MLRTAGVFALLLVTLVNGQTVHNVQIRSGEPFDDIRNPGDAPFPFDSSTEWNLQAEPDSTIKVFCDDIRMDQDQPWTPECEHVYLSFKEDDVEKKVCTTNLPRYQFSSKGPRLTVKFVAKDGSGVVRCVAYSTKEPEPQNLDLQTTGLVQKIGTPSTKAPNFDKVWVLRSPPNTRISLQCDLALGNLETCYKDVMTVDTGDDVKELCGSKKVTLLTKSNKGKVRIQMGENGDFRAHCLVQAITGPNANEYENVHSDEEDSVEITLCDCGRHNAVVSLNVYKHVGDGRMSISYCGATRITPEHVLTAAHCLVNQQVTPRRPVEPQDVTVILPEHNTQLTSGKERKVEAEMIIVHENFLQNETHDIAVIVTKNTIEFNTFIGPICLEREVVPIINRNIILMGWSQTESRNISFLLKAQARVINNNYCHVPDYEICIQRQSPSVCSGDSGGPVVMIDPKTNRFYQIGIVSSRTDFPCQEGVEAHTRVASFYDWIQDAIQKSDSTMSTCPMT